MDSVDDELWRTMPPEKAIQILSEKVWCKPPRQGQSSATTRLGFEGRWISLKKEWPKEGEHVLVYPYYERRYWITTASNRKTWYDANDKVEYEYWPTHWTPLLKAPEGT